MTPDPNKTNWLTATESEIRIRCAEIEGFVWVQLGPTDHCRFVAKLADDSRYVPANMALPPSGNPTFGVPDYTSESSPRSVLAQLEQKVIERVGRPAYVEALSQSYEATREGKMFSRGDDTNQLVTASAESRARACVIAWESVK